MNARQSNLFDGAETSGYDRKLDAGRLTTLLERVKALMLGRWRPEVETAGGSGTAGGAGRSGERWWTIAEVAGKVGARSEASVSARLRDLRKERFGGYLVERRRRGEPKLGIYEYRLQKSAVSSQQSADQRKT